MPGAQLPERKANHSPPPSKKIKNYDSIHAMHRDNFTVWQCWQQTVLFKKSCPAVWAGEKEAAFEMYWSFGILYLNLDKEFNDTKERLSEIATDLLD